MTLCIAGADKVSQKDYQFIIRFENKMEWRYVANLGKSLFFTFSLGRKGEEKLYTFGSMFYFSDLDQGLKHVN